MESVTNSVQSTAVTLPRFGTMTYAETDVIEFPWGIPGFPACHRWLFLTLDAQPGFVWLQSLDDLDVALPAANPWMLYDDYAPDLPTYVFPALEIRDPSDFTLVCVSVVGNGAKEMTMNLESPIVVNLRARKALQVGSVTRGLSRREPIPRTYETAGVALAAKAS